MGTLPDYLKISVAVCCLLDVIILDYKLGIITILLHTDSLPVELLHGLNSNKLTYHRFSFFVTDFVICMKYLRQ